MNSLFSGCSSLKEINITNFKTNKVIDMSCMFYGCISLKELNLSNFTFKEKIKMDSMFYECSSLEELLISDYNFYSATQNGNYKVFYGCSESLLDKIKPK